MKSITSSMTRLRKHAVVVVFFATLCTMFCAPISAAVNRVWEIDLNQIFRGGVSAEFQPLFVDGKIIIGSEDGQVKTVDPETEAIDDVVTLPIHIYSATAYGKATVVFYGRHKSNLYYYHCSVDIRRKTLKGVLREEGLLWKIRGLGVYEKENAFSMFNPAIGRTVYSQPIEHSIKFPVHANDQRIVYVNDANELIELKLPGMGAGALFSAKGSRERDESEQDLLKFVVIGTVQPNIIPDTLDGKTLYYHMANGTIGMIDLEDNEIVWERSYFKQEVTILGPHVYHNSLFYVVSYPRRAGADTEIGKLISLKKDSGQANWLSEDLRFENLTPTQFRQTILAPDKEGRHLRFLDVLTGEEVGSFPIEGTMAKPLVVDNSIYFHTSKKLYRFDFTGEPAWFEKFLYFFRRK